VDALKRANVLTFSLVAVQNRKIMGHMTISSPLSEFLLMLKAGIAETPIAVLPEWQQQGIASALIRSSLNQLKMMGTQGCVVLGDPDFYAEFGFKAVPELILEHVPAQYFQALSFDGDILQSHVSDDSVFSVL